MSLLSRRLAWNQHVKRVASQTVVADLSVRLLSTFTIDPLGPYMGDALCQTFVPEITVGGFDQIVQELFAFDGSAGDCIVVWPRFEDLWQGNWPLLEHDGDATLDRLHEIADVAADRAASNGQTLLFVLPALPQAQPLGVGDAGNCFGVAAVCHRTRESLRSKLTVAPGTLVADAEDVVRQLGIAATFDNRRMSAASIPYTEEAFALMGDRLARLLILSRRGARKVAVVDADNTLWGGVVGEEGADGVDLSGQGPGASFLEFQSYLLALRRAGMIIAVASKNNEADTFEAFGRREMILRRDHLAAWRINWDPKSRNIEAMAEELNLGTASMVFIDDSPMERAEVVDSLPEVAVLAMPEDPAGWWESVARSGVLDRLPPTASDLGRAESYATETQRRVVRSQLSHEEFLRGLELEVSVITPSEADLARFAQLISKTNQFTLGGERHSEASLRTMLKDGAAARLFAAKDRFGDYGVIGAILLRPTSPADAAQDISISSPGLLLDSFVLSCRAMSAELKMPCWPKRPDLAPNG